jgi:hypothetical protein
MRQPVSCILVGVVLGACSHWPPVVETVADVNRLPPDQRDVRCIGCGEAEVAAIAARLRSLDYLFLNTKSPVTDSSISAIATIGTLRQLVVRDASRVSNAGISKLSGMTGLRELMLYDAAHVSDQGLLTLARSKGLSSLYISGAPAVTDEAIKELRGRMPDCSIRTDRDSEPATPPNKGMKLTKLSAAPAHGRLVWLSSRCRLMPAPSRQHAGTASQLIPGVGRT